MERLETATRPALNGSDVHHRNTERGLMNLIQAVLMEVF